MNDLAAFERRNRIIEQLRTNQRVSTRSLSDLYHVSEVTIRHDLRTLESEGWLARIHGGAQSGPRLETELPMSVREKQNLEAKQRIAQAALAFIEDGDTIVLDSSTTALQLSRLLTERRNLTVVTNNYQIPLLLCPTGHMEIIVLGGSVRGSTWSVVGPLAEEFISGLRINKGFFGAAGISLTRGLTDADMREVQIKREMAKASQQLYALVDATKFGKEAFSTTIALERLDCVISNGIPAEFMAYFNQHETQTVITHRD